MKKEQAILENLDCANCAMKLEDAIGQIEGVDSATVDFMTKKLQYELHDGANMETVQNTIGDTIRKIEPDVTITFNNHTSHKSGEEHDHTHESSKNEMQRDLYRIIITIVLIILGIFVSKVNSMAGVGIYLIAYVLVGGEIVLRAVKNIFKGKVFDENFLMTVATIGAFALGDYLEGIAVMLLYQIGELFQSYAVNQSRRSITDLMDIRPDYANKLVDGVEKQVSPNEVAIGDTIIVKPGERIPLDGDVIEGNSMVDTSALTGESVPRTIGVGDAVLSGTVNQNGVLEIITTKLFGESTVNKVLELVENASSKKTKSENFISKFSRYYTPIVVVLAVILAIVPPLVMPGQTFNEWIHRALTFLVISCPCALVISVPLSFFGGIGGASKIGVLVKGSNYLEALAKTETVVFDKTGTLTKGVFKVQEIHTENGFSQRELIRLAAHAESFSSHPISLSLQEEYGKELDAKIIGQSEDIAGFGVRTLVEEQEILAGNEKLMRQENIDFTTGEEVGTIVHVAVDGQYAGYIIISDEIKDDAKQAIQAIKAEGVTNTIMLTGDAKSVGEKVAKELGLDEVFTELLPADKVKHFEEIINKKSSGQSVAFVGDGINDAPVLARADVGIAMGGLGSDAAIEAADIVIMNDEPSKIAQAIDLAKRTLTIVNQNVYFAIGIKVLFLLLGAFGISTMAMAIFADVGVSIIAILNAMRTLNVKKYQ